MSKKFLSIFIMLFITLGLFTGCGDEKSESNGNTDAAAVKISFISAEGESVYSVVRPVGNKDALTASQNVFKAMKDTLGINVKMEYDDARDGVDTYEILVGETNRPETEEAKKLLNERGDGKYNNYIITVIGKKIVIYAHTEASLIAAADYFNTNVLKKEEVSFAEYIYNDTYPDYKTITVNGAPIGRFQFVRPHYNSSYLTQVQMEEIIDYTLTNTGYKMTIAEDMYTASSPSEYEVIVGNTSREGTEKITDADQYKITISGKKVYINGGSAHATAMGVSEFGKLLEKGAVTDADSVTGTYSEAVSSYNKAEYYTLKWGDDFDGTSVDTSKWYIFDKDGGSQGLNGRYSNRKPENITLSDGKLTMAATYGQWNYFGAMISTANSMVYKYGYLEMSALLPHGDGLWSSLWTDSRYKAFGNGELYGQEIDVNECFGNAKTVAANVHKWPTESGELKGLQHTSLDYEPYKNQKRRYALDNGSFNNELHTFGYLWDDDECTFTCDGEVYFTYKNNGNADNLDGLHCYTYVRLSLAVGFANNPLGTIIADDDPAWTESNKFIIDYVNLYQLEDDKQMIAFADELQ